MKSKTMGLSCLLFTLLIAVTTSARAEYYMVYPAPVVYANEGYQTCSTYKPYYKRCNACNRCYSRYYRCYRCSYYTSCNNSCRPSCYRYRSRYSAYTTGYYIPSTYYTTYVHYDSPYRYNQPRGVAEAIEYGWVPYP